MEKFQKQEIPDEVMIAEFISRDTFLMQVCSGRIPFYYVPGVILNQDCELLARIHSCVESCLYTDTEFYCVMEREGSATRSTYRSSDKCYQRVCSCSCESYFFKSGHSLSEDRRLFLNGACCAVCYTDFRQQPSKRVR